MNTDTQMLSRLALAVKGPHEPVTDDDTLDYLLWLAGEHRRQLENAHDWLTVRGVPHSYKGTKGTHYYTLLGRLEQMESKTL